MKLYSGTKMASARGTLREQLRFWFRFARDSWRGRWWGSEVGCSNFMLGSVPGEHVNLWDTRMCVGSSWEPPGV